MKIRIGKCLLGLIACSSATASYGAEIPIDVFARQPEIRMARLSPDGRYLLTVSVVKGQLAVLTVDTETLSKVKSVLSVKADEKVDISWCQWSNSTRVVCQLESTFADARAPSTSRRLVAVDHDGQNLKQLLPRTDTSSVRVIDWTPADPQTILIQGPETLVPNYRPIVGTPAAFKLNVYTGILNEIVPASQGITQFRTDGNGEVRLGTGISGNGKLVYYGLRLGEKQWRSLTKVDAFLLSGAMIPVWVRPGTNTAVAIGPRNGRDALWEIDIADEVPPKLIAEHPEVDIQNPIMEYGTGKLIAYYYQTTRPFVQYEEPKLAAIMRGINAGLSGRFNWPASMLDDYSKLIIESTSETEPGEYLYYDLNTRALRVFARVNSQLDSKQLARMRSLEYPASDGVAIPAYLTVPTNAREEMLPLIVMPHGGSASRTTWSYSYLRQFLAHRGYAVLEMNYRGSNGYGEQWIKSGLQDWTGVIYSDVLAGAKWAIDRRVADPKRICIAGSDFGGLVAMLGAVRDSAVFKCAISIAGVSDHVEHLKQRYDFEVVEKQTGRNIDKERSGTPLYRAKEANSPILLIHGMNDKVVSFEQSDRMQNALKRAGKHVEFFKMDQADHWFERESDRVALLTAIDKFLSANLN